MPESVYRRSTCNRLLYAGGYVLITLIISACSSTPMTREILRHKPYNLPETVELTEVPFFAQETHQCGPAALATILRNSDIDVTPEMLTPKVYLPGRQGTLQAELLASTRRYGRIPYRVNPTLRALFQQLQSGTPILILQNLAIQAYPRWHYAVVIGYDLHEGTIILRSGLHKRYVMDMRVFERTWQRASHWGFVALIPGEIPVNAEETQYFHNVVDFARNNTPHAAIKAYQAGLSHWPGSKLIGMALGNTYLDSAKHDMAKETFQQIVDRYPDYAAAHNNLAYVMMESGDLDRAKMHAEIAIKLGGPYQQEYRSTLQEIISRTSRSINNNGQP